MLRVLAILLLTSSSVAVASAQSDGDKSGYSTGPAKAPETTGQQQPQGWTGPIDTRSGGPPAASPQGETPAGMQSAPDGSSKSSIAPDNLHK
jgi:hypothetical protein